MYLYKRGRIYWSEYQKNGQRFQFSTGKTKKSEAADFVEKIRATAKAADFDAAVKIARAIFASTAREAIPLDGAYERYLETAKSLGRDKLSDTSARKRLNHFAAFVKFARKAAPNARNVDQISPPIAAQFAAELQSLGKSAKTRKNIIGDLGAVWSIFEKLDDQIRNPWRNLSPKDDGGTRLDAFTSDQESALMEAARRVGKDWYPVCVVLRHTGLRYHDVARLKWSAVDLDEAVIRTKPEKTKRHNITVAIPLLPVVVDALREIKDDGRQGEYCFPVHAAYWGKAGALRRALNFQEVMSAAGVTGNYTIHSWRHTAATRLAAAGADIETRMRLLGHTEAETARLYDHAEHLDDSRRALEAAAR